jgi:hypothetical protein
VARESRRAAAESIGAQGAASCALQLWAPGLILYVIRAGGVCIVPGFPRARVVDCARSSRARPGYQSVECARVGLSQLYARGRRLGELRRGSRSRVRAWLPAISSSAGQPTVTDMGAAGSQRLRRPLCVQCGPRAGPGARSGARARPRDRPGSGLGARRPALYGCGCALSRLYPDAHHHRDSHSAVIELSGAP